MAPRSNRIQKLAEVGIAVAANPLGSGSRKSVVP